MFCENFQEHRGQLEAKLQLSALMPYIQKQHVLTSEENERLREIEPARRNHELLEIMEKKGSQFLVTFVKPSPENKGLVEGVGSGHETNCTPSASKANYPARMRKG